MTKSSIQAAPAPAPAPAARATPPAEPGPAVRRGPRPVRGALLSLASLRLTVALFVLALFLVFVGTLAQVFSSNQAVTLQYFRSFYVRVPWQLLVHFGRVFFGDWVPAGTQVGGTFPYPGGWTIGALLLVNLLAAHAVRFKLSWKRSGVLVLHAGLVVLMLNELATGLFAVEGSMTIEQGGFSDYVEHHNAVELAVVDPSDPKVDDVVVVSGRALRRGGTVGHADLPFDVSTERYFPNARVLDSVPDPAANPATAGSGKDLGVQPLPEGAGVEADQKVDAPAAYLTFTDKKTGAKIGTYLTSVLLKPQPVSAGGKEYKVALRFARTYKPYTVQLLKFDHKKYTGTSTPKDFRSTVRLTDAFRGEDRRAEIYMNHPLVYRGETFYQISFLAGDRGTILQVVQNPSWALPYLSCALVTLGMAVHFGIHLNGFLRRRAAA